MTIRHKGYVTNKKKLWKADENTAASAWKLDSDQTSPIKREFEREIREVHKFPRSARAL